MLPTRRLIDIASIILHLLETLATLNLKEPKTKAALYLLSKACVTCGLGIDGACMPSPQRIRSLGARRVVEVAAGREHTLLRLDDGTVCACGRNGDAQLGLRRTMGSALYSAAVPYKVELPEG